MAKETINVTMTVKVTMTPEQAEAYRFDYGVDFVAPEIANRIRPEAEEALRAIRWLKFATVEISKPQIDVTVTVGQSDVG